MTIGRCDKHWAPGLPECEVFTSTYDAGNGDMKTQQLCGPCGGLAQAIGPSGNAVVPFLALLAKIGEQPTPDGIELPKSFFGPDGHILPPPWRYGETTIDLVRDAKRKELRIMMPVSCTRMLSHAEIDELLKLTGTLGEIFKRLVPESWKVVT